MYWNTLHDKKCAHSFKLNVFFFCFFKWRRKNFMLCFVVMFFFPFLLFFSFHIIYFHIHMLEVFFYHIKTYCCKCKVFFCFILNLFFLCKFIFWFSVCILRLKHWNIYVKSIKYARTYLKCFDIDSIFLLDTICLSSLYHYMCLQ